MTPEQLEKRRESNRNYYYKNRERYQQYNAANREKRAESNRKWNQKNSEKRREQKRQYYLNNLEKAYDYAKQYRDKNRERLREKARLYEISHREQKSEYQRNNRERINLRNRQRYQANPQTHRKHTLKYKYGLTQKEYNSLLTEQKGVCAICRKPPAKGKHLHVDHDHIDGKVRGLLCNECNTGIGFLKDSPTIIEAALKYVKQFSQLRLVASNDDDRQTA